MNLRWRPGDQGGRNDDVSDNEHTR
jgi:hypothetical protein